MRLTSPGNLGVVTNGVDRATFGDTTFAPWADNSYNLGASNFRFRDLHLAGRIVGNTAITPPDVNLPYGTLIDGPGVNYVSNPSFEVGLAEWTAEGGTFQRDTNHVVVGGFSGQMDFPAGATGAQVVSPRVPASTGQVWTASVWARSTLNLVGLTNRLRVFVQPYDAAGNPLVNGNASLTTPANSPYVRLVATYTLPANTATVALVFSKDNVDLGVGTFWIDGAQLEQADRASSYLDGSLGPGYSWDGTPHASVSRRAGGFHVLDAKGPLWTPPNQVGFLVDRNSNQALPDMVSTKMTYNGQLHWWGTPAPALSGDLADVIIPVSGYWLLSCYLGHNSNSTGNKSAWFHGATGPGLIFSHFLSGNSHGWGNTRPTYIAAGTGVGVTAYFAGGTVRDISGQFYGVLLERTA